MVTGKLRGWKHLLLSERTTHNSEDTGCTAEHKFNYYCWTSLYLHGSVSPPLRNYNRRDCRMEALSSAWMCITVIRKSPGLSSTELISWVRKRPSILNENFSYYLLLLINNLGKDGQKSCYIFWYWHKLFSAHQDGNHYHNLVTIAICWLWLFEVQFWDETSWLVLWNECDLQIAPFEHE